jgi:hypothetical protein
MCAASCGRRRASARGRRVFQRPSGLFGACVSFRRLSARERRGGEPLVPGRGAASGGIARADDACQPRWCFSSQYSSRWTFWCGWRSIGSACTSVFSTRTCRWTHDTDGACAYLYTIESRQWQMRKIQFEEEIAGCCLLHTKCAESSIKCRVCVVSELDASAIHITGSGARRSCIAQRIGVRDLVETAFADDASSIGKAMRRTY